MSDEHQSPLRKRARLASPLPPPATREDAVADTAQPAEASNTDDDELQQQLSMVGSADPKVVVDILSVENGAEVKFEELLNTVFLAAKEGKLPAILQCFQLIKRSDNTGELMKRHGANDESKNMSLIPAAHFGHLPIVQGLLKAGADQNYLNRKGTTPLMRAAQEGRDEVVQFLLANGADANAANNESMTALMLAAQRGHTNVVTILLKSGSNVNTQTHQGSTALMLTAKRGHTAAVESLLTAGADISLKDDRNKTAAEMANRRGHLDLFLKITLSSFALQARDICLTFSDGVGDN
ncbi:hypothetical protein PybrP1_007539, partial [[Pythium] brassicae (nom. inval.)]